MFMARLELHLALLTVKCSPQHQAAQSPNPATNPARPRGRFPHGGLGSRSKDTPVQTIGNVASFRRGARAFVTTSALIRLASYLKCEHRSHFCRIYCSAPHDIKRAGSEDYTQIMILKKKGGEKNVEANL